MRLHAAIAQPSGRPERPQAPPDSDEQRIADLVLASRILVNEGVLDSFGHVTVRSLKNPTHYFMPRAMPPALVTASDIVELDADSVAVDPRAPRTNGEGSFTAKSTRFARTSKPLCTATL